MIVVGDFNMSPENECKSKRLNCMNSNKKSQFAEERVA